MTSLARTLHNIYRVNHEVQRATEVVHQVKAGIETPPVQAVIKLERYSRDSFEAVIDGVKALIDRLF
jgi:hypothetical protein